jgi:hypothetical protein
MAEEHRDAIDEYAIVDEEAGTGAREDANHKHRLKA